MCEGGLEDYYTRFGFLRVQSDLPPYFRRIARLAGQRFDLAVMRRA